METPRLRKPYPTDVTDEEWAFVAPYLSLMRPDAPQRVHDPREVYNALRWIVRAGAPWRMLPTNFPPWEAVYQQTQHWLAAGCFEAMVHDLRALLRWLQTERTFPRPPFSTAAPCAAPRRAGDGPATTGTNERRAARSMPPSIPWATCWP